MRDDVDHLKDRNLNRCTPRPDRTEVADVWLQSGIPEGISMEWVLDRYNESGAQIMGHI